MKVENLWKLLIFSVMSLHNTLISVIVTAMFPDGLNDMAEMNCDSLTYRSFLNCHAVLYTVSAIRPSYFFVKYLLYIDR